MSLRIYISGKITGLDLNVSEGIFNQMEDLLSASGHTPVNPWKLKPYDPQLTWVDYMLADIDAIFACDAMLMLDNWTDSNGAKIEHQIAVSRGMKIYYPNQHSELLS